MCFSGKIVTTEMKALVELLCVRLKDFLKLLKQKWGNSRYLLSSLINLRCLLSAGEKTQCLGTSWNSRLQDEVSIIRFLPTWFATKFWLKHNSEFSWAFLSKTKRVLIRLTEFQGRERRMTRFLMELTDNIKAIRRCFQNSLHVNCSSKYGACHKPFLVLLRIPI